MWSSKRARSPIPRPTSPSSSVPSSPTVKAARTSATPPPNAPSSSTTGIVCELPPTCHHRRTVLSGTRELEAHYATYHAHVCEVKGCGCVFPDARLLELHQTECHDPLAAVRKDRGEKIFACHIATCPRKFSTPKTRRMHLIQAHGYPKEYFFAVTNKGVGGLLKRWGEGVSMLRKPWRAREGDDDDEDEDEPEEAPEEERSRSASEPRTLDAKASDQEDEDEEDEILLEKLQIERPSARAAQTTANEDRGGPSVDRRGRNPRNRDRRPKPSADVDGLAHAMDSLSLVPTSIQFGRGAKRGTQGRGGGQARGGGSMGRGGAPRNVEGAMDVDYPQARGRGRGRGVPQVPRGAAIRGVLRGRGRGLPPSGGSRRNVNKA